jgi:hypothetical protein
MRPDYKKVLAGGGIDYHYMVSPDKTKPSYLDGRGARIWDNAVAEGMDYRGFVSNTERDALLRNAKYLIDPSWSRKYAKSGDHFNRTPIEGIIAGCVPIARNLGISDNLQGEGLLFKPGVNYHMIPWDATPKQFGEQVDSIMSLSEKRRLSMLEEGRLLLPRFDALTVAQAYVDFARGKNPNGALGYCKMGKENAEMRAASAKVMEEHFQCG